MNQEQFQKYIGEKIKYYREKRNFSLKDAALLLDMGISNISRLEHGRTNLTTYNLYRILEKYNVSFEEFFKDYDIITIDFLLSKLNKNFFLYPNIPINKNFYVYFIVLNKEIIYVGKSKDIHTRLKKNYRVEKGDSVYCINFESEIDMDNYEGAFIQLLNPCFNKQREGLNSEIVNNIISELKFLLKRT